MRSSDSGARVALERLALQVAFPESPIRQAGVDLGGRDGAMAEEVLNRSQVGAAAKEIYRESMT